MAQLIKKGVFSNLPSLDTLPDIASAISQIYRDTGEKVSAQTANSRYNVIVSTTDISTSNTGRLFMQLDEDMVDTNYLTTNAANRIVSSNDAFTGEVILWGSTVTDGKYSPIFKQYITMTGNTPVHIPTPLAFPHRIERNGSSFGMGTISVYSSSSSVTTGIPTSEAYIYLINRSSNSGSTINNVYSGIFVVPDGYYFVLETVDIVHIAANNKQYVRADIQVAEYGESFVTKSRLSKGNASKLKYSKDNLVYAGPNSTLRIWLDIAGVGSNSEIKGYFTGYLCAIID